MDNFFFVGAFDGFCISNLICDLQGKIIHYHWACNVFQDKDSISSRKTLLHFFPLYILVPQWVEEILFSNIVMML